MFKKAARFQSETRARRNIREPEKRVDQREADDVREVHAAKNLKVPLPFAGSTPRIEALKIQFEQVLPLVDYNSSSGLEVVKYFVDIWNAASPVDRLTLAHLKCRLAKLSHIVEERAATIRLPTPKNE